MNNESVGKKIVEALKKQAENMEMEEKGIDTALFEDSVVENDSDDIFASESNFMEESEVQVSSNFFDDVEEKEPMFSEVMTQNIVDNSYTLIKGKEPYIVDKTLIISVNVNVASIVEDEFDERNLTNALKIVDKKYKIKLFNKKYI